MAVVGEAEIIVRAITTGVKDDLRKGFSGIDDVVKDAGKSMGRVFRNDFAREAEAARSKWTRLVKTGYIVQTMLGTVVVGLSSLVGGLAAVAGAAGGAAASLAALGNIVVALPLGLLTARLALGGVLRAVQQADDGTGSFGLTVAELREQLQQLKFDAEEAAITEDQAALNLEKARANLLRIADLPPNSIIRRQAEIDFREADLAYRRAKDRAADLQDELSNPQQDDSGGGRDPFEGLTPAQKQFAEFLISLKPLLTDLKEAAGDSFLPVLEEQMRRLLSLNDDGYSFFITLREGIRDISDGLGDFVEAFADVLTDTEVLKNLAQIFEDAADNIAQFGVILANYFASFTGILVAAQPVTERFLNFLERKSGAFRNFISVKQASGELEDFFDRAGDLAADFGKIFGNIFGYLGDLIKANFGPVSGGQFMLNWLEDATLGWATLRDRVGEVEFDSFFMGAADNSRAILQSIGELIRELGKLGDMPEVAETFRILGEGAPALARIFEEGQKAGVVLAELLVSLTEIFAVLSDASGPRVFFDALNVVAGAVKDAFSNQVVANAVNFAGAIAAAGLAMGTMKILILFLSKALIAPFIGLYNYLKGLPAMFMAAQAAGTTAGFAIKTAFGFVGVLAGIAIGLVALNEEFKRTKREGVTSAEDIRNAFIQGGSGLDAAFDSLKGNASVIVDSTADFKLFGQFAVKTTERLKINFEDSETRAQSVRIALRAMTEDITGVGTATNNFGYDTKLTWDEVKTAFQNTGQALSQIAISDMPSAVRAFNDLTNEYGLNRDEQFYLLEQMPLFTDELKRQATEVGLTTDKQTLLAIATGKIDTEQIKAARSGEDMVDVIADLEQAAEDAKREVEELKDEIFNFGATNLDAREANRQLEEAIDAVTEAIKDNGKSLDVGTEEGRRNQEVLDRLAEAALGAADANYELTGDVDQLRKDMERAREELRAAAEEMGLSEEAANNLATTLLGNEYKIDFTIDKLSEEEARRVAAESAASLQRALNEIPVQFRGASSSGPAIFKDGGFVQRFSPGGYVSGAGTARSDSIPAMLSNGEYVINARATAANRMLLDAINANKEVSLRPNIAITVNPSPGMDERQLAAAVSRRLAYEIRKGAV